MTLRLIPLFKVPIFLFSFCFGLVCFAEESKETEKIVFTKDYFSDQGPVFEKQLSRYIGRPDVTYLELGVYEGRSLLWVMDHILTHPSSRAVGVDIFPEDRFKIFNSNLRISGHEKRVQSLKGYFNEVLKTLQPKSFDIIYLDGGHMGWTTLETTMLAWPLLKTGGVFIFDDYLWNDKLWPAQFSPKAAIDGFILTHKNFIQIEHRGYQVFLKKIESSCSISEYACLPLNEWAYYWDSKVLRHNTSKKNIKLTKSESTQLEKILNSKKLTSAEDAVKIQAFAREDKKLMRLLNSMTEKKRD